MIWGCEGCKEEDRVVQQRTDIESLCWCEGVVHNRKGGMKLCEESNVTSVADWEVL